MKQAIYGWRGGEAEIFDAIQQELPGLAEAFLDTSYRSNPVVINTVNRVFEHLAANAVLQQDKYVPAATAWAGRFHHHTTAKRDLAGHCRLVAARRPEQGAEQEDRQSLATCRFAADEVARLHREAPGFSIGVLVRKNATLARIIYELGLRGIEASEEGGNPLCDSPAVELILSLVTLADHPGHTAARFHVARSPLGPPLGLERHDDDAAACRPGRRASPPPGRCRLRPDPRRPGRAGSPRTAAPATRAACCNWSRWPTPTSRPPRCGPATSRPRSATPGSKTRRGSAVRVMTVHQAKGLQFNVVVLPELDVRLTGQPPQLVVNRPGPAQPINRVLRYVSKDVRPLLPGPMRAMFDEHDRRIIEESLCVFYVAMTRAVHALHMIVAPSAPNERSLPATLSGLLRAALCEGRKLEPGSVAFELGDAEWAKAEGGERKAESGEAKAEPQPPASAG